MTLTAAPKFKVGEKVTVEGIDLITKIYAVFRDMESNLYSYLIQSDPGRLYFEEELTHA